MTEHLLFSVILQWPAEAPRNLTSPLAPNVLYPSLPLSVSEPLMYVGFHVDICIKFGHFLGRICLMWI